MIRLVKMTSQEKQDWRSEWDGGRSNSFPDEKSFSKFIHGKYIIKYVQDEFILENPLQENDAIYFIFMN